MEHPDSQAQHGTAVIHEKNQKYAQITLIDRA
jgi:hypothetical protein